MSARFAQIEPTTRCNFTCGFCAGRAMRQGDLAWEAFERFLGSNPDLEHVELQGEGEPLMHPRFFDMVAACRARNVRISLITNGSLLAASAESIVTSGIASVMVSMESTDEDEFQAIRGGRFTKVKDGLRELMDRRRARAGSSPRVGIAVTVLRRTRHAMRAIVALYEELGLDGGIVVQPLQRMDAYTRTYDRDMRDEGVTGDEFRDHLDRSSALLSRLERTACPPRFYDELFAGWRPDHGACPWLETGAYLNIDGEIRSCCFHKAPPEPARQGADAEAWHAREQKGLRHQLRRGVVPTPCAGCPTADAITSEVRAVRRRFGPP